MRKVILVVNLTLDSAIAGPSGELDWMPARAGRHRHLDGGNPENRLLEHADGTAVPEGPTC